MQLNKNIMLAIVIGDLLIIFLWALIANLTTPKVEIIENVEYIFESPKVDLTDNVIIGKHYDSEEYYLVVYNKAKHKGEDHMVEYNVWKAKEIGSRF
jgi:ribonuclease R